MQYKFSPIKNKSELIEAVKYVATETSNMYATIIGESPVITSLTIFSHFDDEFDNLKQILAELGNPYNENNGPRITLHEPINVEGHSITHLRIRHPDQERPQVGCNDFDVKDYKEFEEKYLLPNSGVLHLIERDEYNMIEFKHPDFPNVLGYVVS